MGVAIDFLTNLSRWDEGHREFSFINLSLCDDVTKFTGVIIARRVGFVHFFYPQI
jgi:hypothetical protein